MAIARSESPEKMMATDRLEQVARELLENLPLVERWGEDERDTVLRILRREISCAMAEALEEESNKLAGANGWAHGEQLRDRARRYREEAGDAEST
jgi:hypothetical protein